MKACLSPNGGVFHGYGPVKELLVATAGGLLTFEREGPGKEWKKTRENLKGQHISGLMLEPKRGGLFAGVHGPGPLPIFDFDPAEIVRGGKVSFPAAPGGGLYRSVDGGVNWERIAKDLPYQHIYCMASAEQDGEVVLYVGTEPAHLFKSKDYGETWEELTALRNVPGVETHRWNFAAAPRDGHVKGITIHPREPKTIFVAVEQGALLRSTDGGNTFHELTNYIFPDDITYRDIHRIAVRPSNPSEMYFTSGDGLRFSQDGGSTWEALSGREWLASYPDAILMSPFDDKVMFLAGAGNHIITWMQKRRAAGRVIRSRDKGRTWEVLSHGIPGDMHGDVEALAMYAWSAGYTLFAGNTDGEVYVSDDGGDNWSCVAKDLAPVTKDFHYQMIP